MKSEVQPPTTPIPQFENTIPPSSSSSSSSSTMEITYDNWRLNKLSITPTNTTTPLYKVSAPCLHQTLTFTSASTGQDLAKSSLHCYKSSFTVQHSGTTIPVASDKIWRIQRSYASPAFGGKKLLWKTTRSCKRLEFVCLDDERAMPLARVVLSNRWKRLGVIEFDQGEMPLSEEQVEELVVLGITVAWQVAQSQVAAGAAAAASGAA